MSEYFNRDCESITRIECVALRRSRSYALVRETNLGGNVRIETWWDGEAVRQGPSGPEIFRTIVFNGPDRSDKSIEAWYSYATEELALQHHDALVDIHDDEHMTPQDRRFSDMTEEIS